MKNIKLELTPIEILAINSALRMWGKSRYNREDKMVAHDLIDKIMDSVNNADEEGEINE